jgi:hypothetical protein
VPRCLDQYEDCLTDEDCCAGMYCDGFNGCQGCGIEGWPCSGGSRACCMGSGTTCPNGVCGGAYCSAPGESCESPYDCCGGWGGNNCNASGQCTDSCRVLYEDCSDGKRCCGDSVTDPT